MMPFTLLDVRHLKDSIDKCVSSMYNVSVIKREEIQAMVIKRTETAKYIYETEARKVVETFFFIAAINDGRYHRDCTAYRTKEEAFAAMDYTKRLWGWGINAQLYVESRTSTHTEIIKHRRKKRI